MFIKVIDTGVVILLLYVDDIIVIGSHNAAIQFVINDLSAVFDLKDLGPLTYCLGLQIQYQSNGIFVHQRKYVIDLIAKAGMVGCKSCSTPCLPHSILRPDDGDAIPDPTLYRSLVGALQYLTFTRPDIVNTTCQFLHAPID